MADASHALFIPTHRLLPSRPMDSAIAEARVASALVGRPVPLVIVDDAREGAIRAENRARCAAAGAAARAPVWFVPRSFQAELAGAIASALALDVTLLIGEPLAYGRVFNLLYLIGRILGVDRFHRRDSDMAALAGAAPIAVEVELLGRPFEGVTVDVTGATCLGDPDLRFDDCMRNERFLRAVLRSWGVMSEGFEAADRDPLTEMFRARTVQPDRRVRVGLRSPDYASPGNVAFTDPVYRCIPSSPVELQIGTDCCPFSGAQARGLGMVVHGLHIDHDQAGDRLDREGLARYWTAMIDNGDAVNVYSRGWRRLEAWCAEHAEPDDDSVRRELVRCLREAHETAALDERAATFEPLVEALDATGVDEYRHVAARYRATGPRAVVAATGASIERYAELLARWGDIAAWVAARAEPLRRQLVRAGALVSCHV